MLFDGMPLELAVARKNRAAVGVRLLCPAPIPYMCGSILQI